MRAILMLVPMTLAFTGWAAASPSYDLDTPIETLAANPAAASVLNRDMPGLLTNENYGVFKALTLKQVAVLSGGRMDKQTLTQTETDLHALPDGPAVHKINY